MMRSRLAARLAAATAALAAVVAACAIATPAGASAASEPTATDADAPAGSTTVGGLPTEGREPSWEKVVPGGDCMCADGSDFYFWDRRANPTKVVLYLDGGGTCVDAETCAFTGENGENDYYNYSLVGENPEFPGQGMLDFDRADNPFANYSFLYMGSCTGDADLGDVTNEYAPGLTVEHNGFVNGSAVLDYLAEHYPRAKQVVVVGKTAGSIAAPVYSGLVSDLLPRAKVTVFGAQSGAFPDLPDFNEAYLGELWGVYDNMPDWEVNEGLTARDWGPLRFWIQAGLHDPDIVMARFDYAYDPNAARAVEWMGGDASDLFALTEANHAAIEAAGVDQHTYIAPGAHHGILDLDVFYEVEVNGVRLVDWVRSLLKGRPLGDVHCEECEAP